MTVHIVTDSASDIPNDVIDALHITVVPLTISFGDQSYRDGIDLDADDFYARLQHERELPKTSQPPPALFEYVYTHLITQGDVVSIHLSHKFSGTVETARSVARELAPDQIGVVDTGLASMGVGFCAIAAAKAAQAGASREECVAVAESVSRRVDLLVAFETLEYLRRGGRIGRARAFLGGLLRLKPLLTIKDGEAFPVSRARSHAKAMDELLAICAKHKRITDVVVLNTTTPAEAEDLARRAHKAAPDATLYAGRFGSVLGAHGGPGMIGFGVVFDDS